MNQYEEDEASFIGTVIFAFSISILLGLIAYVLALPSSVQEIAANTCEPYDGVRLIQPDESGFTCNNGDIHYVMELDQ